MTKLKGNKGEWSEIYTLFYVLKEGRVYGADAEIHRIEEMRFDVDGVVRNESGIELLYRRNDSDSVIEVIEGDEIIDFIELDDLIDNSEILLDTMRGSDGSFSIDPIEEFMDQMRCHKLKAPSSDKSDITLVINDPRSGTDGIKLGFSIKSMMGHASTLLNAGNTTNFIYRLRGPVTQEVIDHVNDRKKGSKLSDVYSIFKEKGIDLSFECMESGTFDHNLVLIDSKLPEIVSEMLKLYYLDDIHGIRDQIRVLEHTNPMNYAGCDVPYYAYKIKKMLTAFALGMVPSKASDGREKANGGYIIVRKDGEVLCYNVYNRNEFEDYLLNNTRLETGSTGRHGFSRIYKGEDGDFFIKLNLQIRFL